MSNFESLAAACENWFDKALCDLPDALRLRVEDEFFPMPWDRLSATGRRSIAMQLDYVDDPSTESARHFAHDWAERKHSLLVQITEWQEIATPTASDLAVKEARLVALRQALTQIKAEVFAPGKSAIGTAEWRKKMAQEAANVRHDQPGGSRDKKRQIRELWATGKYSSRDICAEQECAALEMSFSTARQALRNTPEPSRC